MSRYRLIGRDGAPAQPAVEADTLTEWVLQLRVGPSTRLWDETTGQVVKAGLVPDLASVFAEQARRTHYNGAPPPPHPARQSGGPRAVVPSAGARNALLAVLVLGLGGMALLGGSWMARRGASRPADPVGVAAAPAAQGMTQGGREAIGARLAAGTTLPTRVGNAVLRAEPFKRAPHRKILARGTPLTALGAEENGYVRVSMPRGTTGWVIKWALDPDTPRPQN